MKAWCVLTLWVTPSSDSLSCSSSPRRPLTLNLLLTMHSFGSLSWLGIFLFIGKKLVLDPSLIYHVKPPTDITARLGQGDGVRRLAVPYLWWLIYFILIIIPKVILIGRASPFKTWWIQVLSVKGKWWVKIRSRCLPDRNLYRVWGHRWPWRCFRIQIACRCCHQLHQAPPPEGWLGNRRRLWGVGSIRAKKIGCSK